MSNKVDYTIDNLSGKIGTTLKEKPVFSALSTLFAVAATANVFLFNDVGGLTAVTAAVSPLASAGLVAAAGVNLFRDRSKLSKVFSAVAGVAGLGGLVVFASQLSAPGMDALVAPLFSTVGMAVSGTFNLISHYTRNAEVSIKPTEAKSVEAKPKM